MVVVLVTIMAMSGGECSETHCHQLDEKEHEYCHEHYAFGPVVVCYGTCEARIGKGVAGGSEEVDERRGYDDTGAEVFRNEERPFRDPYASMAAGVDGECGPWGRQ